MPRALHTLRVARDLLPPPDLAAQWGRVWDAVAPLRTLAVLDYFETHKPPLPPPVPDRQSRPAVWSQCHYRTPLPRAFADAPLCLHGPVPTPLVPLFGAAATAAALTTSPPPS